MDKLSDAINNVDWSDFYLSNDVDEKCEILQNTIHTVMKVIPRKTITMTSKDKEWMTPLCKFLINKRWEAFRNKDFPLYLHYREKVRNEINKCKNIWFTKCRSKKGGLWNLVRNAAPKKLSGINALLHENESAFSLANKINTDFIPKTSRMQSYEVCQDLVPNQHFHIEEIDVYNALNKLNASKAMGSDNIPNRVLKTCCYHIVQPLSHLYNVILLNATYPLAWKFSAVVPLPKTNPPNISKLRPVSLLPNMSKIFESLLLRSIKPLLLDQIACNQHGFVPKGSTTTCLISIQDKVTRHLDLPRVTAVTIVAFDLSKAFDMVPHDLLLRKLSFFVPNNLLRLFASYLSNRTQSVKINNVYSNPQSVTTGVPQGSVLSPLLFNIFFNDLQFSSDCDLFKYADDATLIIPHYSLDPTIYVNKKIEFMLKWCNDNHLTLNTDKTQIMTIKKSSDVVQHPNHVPNINILGVIFDEKLKWDLHINKMYKKAAKNIYILKQLKSSLPRKDMVTLYNSLIVSILTYAGSLYIKLPQSLERYFIKISKRCHLLICDSHCSCNSIKQISNLRLHQATRLFHKASADKTHPIHNIIPDTLHYTKKYRQPFSATNRRKNAFIPTITEIINNST